MGRAPICALFALAATLALPACLQSPPGVARDGGGDPDDDAGRLRDSGAFPDGTFADASACSTVFADGFGEAELQIGLWDTNVGDGGAVSVSNGRVHLKANSVDAFVSLDIVGRELLNLVDSELVATVSFTHGTSGGALLGWTDGNTMIGVFVDPSHIGGAKMFPDFESYCTETCPPYDPAVHVAWRVRADGQTLHFEVSGGNGWLEVGDPTDAPFLEGLLVLYTYADMPDPAESIMSGIIVHDCTK